MSMATANDSPATSDDLNQFIDVYDCAKNNFQWTKVSNAVKENPHWLLRVPPGRRWTILHQVVFCGNPNHLHDVLLHQVPNENFVLLKKALDDKTIREVASERAHIHPDMMHYVERIVALDQLLINAKEENWDLVIQSLRQKPSMVNEKPPHRKYNLPFFLAINGLVNRFQELADFCQFKFNLTVDGKKIHEIARDHEQQDFAEYVESICQNINNLPGEVDTPVSPQESTDSFYSGTSLPENPGSILFSLLSSSIGDMLHPTIITIPHHAEEEHQAPTTAAATAIVKPEISNEEQAIYDKMIIENAKNLPASFCLQMLTCSITKSIMRDPVMAADGYTYERSAITKWFQTSSRSPLTNQPLASLELLPNHAINSILQFLNDHQIK